MRCTLACHEVLIEDLVALLDEEAKTLRLRTDTGRVIAAGDSHRLDFGRSGAGGAAASPSAAVDSVGRSTVGRNSTHPQAMRVTRLGDACRKPRCFGQVIALEDGHMVEVNVAMEGWVELYTGE